MLYEYKLIKSNELIGKLRIEYNGNFTDCIKLVEECSEANDFILRELFNRDSLVSSLEGRDRLIGTIKDLELGLNTMIINIRKLQVNLNHRFINHSKYTDLDKVIENIEKLWELWREC